jgi:hypothetical protein
MRQGGVAAIAPLVVPASVLLEEAKRTQEEVVASAPLEVAATPKRKRYSKEHFLYC